MRALLPSSAMLAALAVLAAACTEGPTGSAPELQGPLLSHSSCKGKVHCGAPGPDANPPIIIEFRDGVGDLIRSDGRGPYVDGKCGVQATFNLSDARLKPDHKKIHPKDAETCGGREARSVKVTLLDGIVHANFFKVNEVEEVEVNGTVHRSAVVGGPFPEDCGSQLKFNPNLDLDSDWVNVTNNGVTWTVATKPDPDDVAVCFFTETPSYHNLPFSITVTLK